MSHRLASWLAVLVFASTAPVVAADDVASIADRPTDPAAAAPDPSADAPPREAESDEDAENGRILEQVLREHAAEQASVASIRETAAFQQVRVVEPPAGTGMVLAFQPLPDGGLVIATGAGQGYGEQSLAGTLASIMGLSPAKKSAAPANKLVWLDADGAETRSAPLPFAAKGLTIAPDGAVIAVGGDRVVVFTATGEQEAEAEAPHFTLTDEELDQLRGEIADQHREQLSARREQYERIIGGREDLEKVPEAERTPRQKAELARARMMERSYEAMLARENASAEAVVTAGLAKARGLHRVAASRDHLFLVTNEPAGYGFAVWRCGRDFTSPEKIVGGLSGCCGQMDVQVIGDELVIAENSRHRVAIYGLDGEPRRTFGRASRAAIREGFGGCCNPMNACPGPDGTLLLSESSGIVKQFAADGTLLEILGAANVQPGCKNSSIGFAADGRRLYYLDIQKGRVLVMEKKS